MVINQYSGRIGRKHYALGLLLFLVLLLAALGIIYGIFSANNENVVSLIPINMVFIFYVFSLHARRLHDLGKSGWYSLLGAAPGVASILFIYLLFAKGKDEANQYGSKPLNETKFFGTVFNGTNRTA